LTETLIVDADGVYDSRELNDRLLLGLKGTMWCFDQSRTFESCTDAAHQIGTHFERPPISDLLELRGNHPWDRATLASIVCVDASAQCKH
jgi:hypothetical protein